MFFAIICQYSFNFLPHYFSIPLISVSSILAVAKVEGIVMVSKRGVVDTKLWIFSTLLGPLVLGTLIEGTVVVSKKIIVDVD